MLQLKETQKAYQPVLLSVVLPELLQKEKKTPEVLLEENN